MRLDQLIAQADEVIEKRASKAPVVTPELASESDETVKLASFLRDLEPGSVGTSEPSPFQMTFIEKLASAVAVVEVLGNIEEFNKLAEFEAKALAAGHTQEQVDAFLMKQAGLAGDIARHPATKGIGILAATHAAAGAFGHSKGKKKGYEQGQADFMRALQEQSAPAVSE